MPGSYSFIIANNLFYFLLMLRLGLTLHGEHGHSHGGHGHSHGSDSSLESSHSHMNTGSKGASDDVEIQDPKKHKKHKDINVRAAAIHVIGDLVQSVGVFIAAILIYFKVLLYYVLIHISLFAS